jgi:hypothetical protein
MQVHSNVFWAVFWIAGFIIIGTGIWIYRGLAKLDKEERKRRADRDEKKRMLRAEKQDRRTVQDERREMRQGIFR